MLCTVYAANNCTTAAHKPVLIISLSCIEVCPKSGKTAHKPGLLHKTLRYLAIGVTHPGPDGVLVNVTAALCRDQNYL